MAKLQPAYTVFSIVSAKVIFIWTRVAKFNLFVSNRKRRRKHSRRVCAIPLQYTPRMKLRLQSVMKSNYVQLCQRNYLWIVSINYTVCWKKNALELVFWYSLSLFSLSSITSRRKSAPSKVFLFKMCWCAQRKLAHTTVHKRTNAHRIFASNDFYFRFFQFTCINECIHTWVLHQLAIRTNIWFKIVFDFRLAFVLFMIWIAWYELSALWSRCDSIPDARQCCHSNGWH